MNFDAQESTVLDHHFLARVFRPPLNATLDGTSHYSTALNNWLGVLRDNGDLADTIRLEERALRELVGDRKVRLEILALLGSGKTTLMYFLRQSTDGSCMPELPDNDDILPHIIDDADDIFKNLHSELKSARAAVPPLLKLLYDPVTQRFAASTIQAVYFLVREYSKKIFEDCIAKGLCIHDGTSASERFNFSEAFHSISLPDGSKLISDDGMKIIHDRFVEVFGTTPDKQPHAIINYSATPQVAFDGVQNRDRPVERSKSGAGVDKGYLEFLRPFTLSTPQKLRDWGYRGAIIDINRDEIHIPHRPEDYVVVLRTVRAGLEGVL